MRIRQPCRWWRTLNESLALWVSSFWGKNRENREHLFANVGRDGDLGIRPRDFIPIDRQQTTLRSHKIPFLSPFFAKTVILNFRHFSKSISHSLSSNLPMILLWVNWWILSKYLAKFLNCRNNTITRRLKEFGYKNMSTLKHHSLSPNHDRERLQIFKLLLDR